MVIEPNYEVKLYFKGTFFSHIHHNFNSELERKKVQCLCDMTFKLLAMLQPFSGADVYLQAKHLHSSAFFVVPRFSPDKLNTSQAAIPMCSTWKGHC